MIVVDVEVQLIVVFDVVGWMCVQVIGFQFDVGWVVVIEDIVGKVVGVQVVYVYLWMVFIVIWYLCVICDIVVILLVIIDVEIVFVVVVFVYVLCLVSNCKVGVVQKIIDWSM